MQSPPRQLDGADVLVWAPIGSIVNRKDVGARGVPGEEPRPAAALAIAVSTDYPRQYCLFHCDKSWRVLADTCHDTLELAQRQAEAEYAGVSGLWRTRA